MKEFKAKLGLMIACMPMMSYMACTSVLAEIAEAFPDASVSKVQMLTYSANLVNIIVSILIGKLTPYVYKKKLIILSEFIFPICGLIIFLYHPNLTFILIMTFLMGIPVGVHVTCVGSLICDCFDQKTQARLMGLQGAFISVGSMIFISLASWLGKDHWERAYLSFLLVFVIIIIEMICLPQGKLDKKKEKGQKIPMVPAVTWIYMFIALFNGIFLATFNNNVSMLIDIRNLGGSVEAGYASSIFSFVGIIGGILTGIVVIKIKRYIFPIGIALGVIGYLLMLFGGNFLTICLGGVFCGWCSATVGPAGNYFAANDANDYNRSYSIAIFNAGNGGGHMLSSLLLGLFVSGLPLSQRIPETFKITAIGASTLLVITLIAVVIISKKYRNLNTSRVE